ncbi:uncharacterized protein LOC119720369 [Patiria miniata]|uniref:Uncharacterized protein n=1 Tax=Patiria miniata TaxID=46514 RepID=A0A913Z299_PATMI|nr:uncharacterized protein LOC119720369 [Patiria miniata]
MTGKMLLLSVLLVSSITVVHSGKIQTTADCTMYLLKYGYVRPTTDGTNVNEEEITAGIYKFQSMANIQATGECDEATKAMMNMPRCGFPDFDDDMDAKRKKRYSLHHTKWSKTELTYRIDSVTSDIPDPSHVANTLANALRVWSAVTTLTFTNDPLDEAADLVINFHGQGHDVDVESDGPGGVLAFAYLPEDGTSFFDDNETWSINNSPPGVDLFQVAVHEFGHSLGLLHSNITDAVMAPYYRGYDPNFSLHEDDIAGIQALYGVPNTTAELNSTSEPIITIDTSQEPTSNEPTTTPRPTSTSQSSTTTGFTTISETTTTPEPTSTPQPPSTPQIPSTQQPPSTQPQTTPQPPSTQQLPTTQQPPSTQPLSTQPPSTQPPTTPPGQGVLFPFGVEAGDTFLPPNDDGSSGSISLSSSFPLYSYNHDSLFVNTNGVISFLVEVSGFTPLSFPLDGDRRLVAVFWGDVNTNSGGSVSYRELHPTGNQELFDRSNTIIRHASDHSQFSASWMFIATWNEVPFYGASSAFEITNTFQAVLVTDGSLSFAIYNYEDIRWTTGTASGGSSTGLGGTPAQVGLNSGDGVNYCSLPDSRTDAIVDVDLQTNIGTTGRFLFRVDSTSEIDNGCDILNDPDDCDPNPCENGGICADGFRMYTCTCVNGYTSANCSIPPVIDECDPASPSHNCDVDAICTDTRYSFICTCSAGYAGNGTFCTDVQSPNITCPTDQTVYTNCRKTYSTVSLPDADFASDNSGVYFVSIEVHGSAYQASDTVNLDFSASPYLLRYTATDEAANYAECDMNITVADEPESAEGVECTGPAVPYPNCTDIDECDPGHSGPRCEAESTVQCPEVGNTCLDEGVSSVSVGWTLSADLDPSSDDITCRDLTDGATVNITGGVFGIGPHHVVCSSNAGAFGDCLISFGVSSYPRLAVPAVGDQCTEPDTDTATVTWTEVHATDAGEVTIDCTNYGDGVGVDLTGGVFGVGNHTVTCTVTNDLGCVTSKNFTFTLYKNHLFTFGAEVGDFLLSNVPQQRVVVQ